MPRGYGPSKSCEPCRLKRRRCDLQRPACSQCLRARIDCPGYKDAFALRLRDETTSTAQRAQRQSASPPSDQGSNVAQDTLTIFRPPAVQPAAVARTFFMQAFAAHGAFNYLPHFYNALLDEAAEQLPTGSQPRLDLGIAIDAPALVVLSRELKQPRLLSQAYRYYASHLSATQAALADPTRCTLDSTLMSILLLGLFESLVFEDRHEAWEAHASGAAALLEMRGPAQLDTELGKRLFLHASAGLRQRSSLCALPLSPGLNALQGRATAQLAAQPHALRVYSSVNELFDEFTELRCDLVRSNLTLAERIARTSNLVRNADRVYAAFSAMMPPTLVAPTEMIWPPAAVKEAHTLMTEEGQVHAYPSFDHAKRWNNLHMIRVYTAEMVRNLQNEIQSCQSEALLHPDVDDLLAVDHVSMACSATQLILQTLPFITQMANIPATYTNVLVLPLASAALVDVPPGTIRTAARQGLEYIATLGVLGARSALEMVQRTDMLEPWVIMPHNL